MKGKYGRTRPLYSEFEGQVGVIRSGVLTLDDFTDVSTTGYVDLGTKLPAGAIPLAWKATTDIGFTDEKRYTPADGTKILFTQYAASPDATDADMVLDLTGCYVYAPSDDAAIAFVQSDTNHTITDDSDGFDTDEFGVGDLVLVQGTASNDGIYTLTAAAVGTLTVTLETLTTETAPTGVTFTKLNNEASGEGGFVDKGFVTSDDITISGAASDHGTIDASDISAVKEGIITLSNNALADAEAGIAGITFTKEITTVATVIIGSSDDPNRFTADETQSVAATGSKGSMALAVDACDGIASEQTVRLTVTETSDFTSYTGGALSAKLFYLT